MTEHAASDATVRFGATLATTAGRQPASTLVPSGPTYVARPAAGPVSRGVIAGRFATLSVLLTAAPAIFGFSWLLPFGDGSLYFADLLLPVAALAVLPAALRTRGVWLSGLLVLLCAAGVLDGMYHGADTRWLIHDGRAPVYVVLGATIGVYLARDQRNWNWCLNALTGFLGLVALIDVLSQVTPRSIVGASNDAVLYYGTTVINLASRRTELATDTLALVVLAGIVGAGVAGLEPSKALGRARTVILFSSGVAIMFLADSRNTLIGIAVACVAGFVAPVGVSHGPAIAAKLGGLVRSAARSASMVCALALPTAVLLYSGAVSNQLSTYDARVLQGLSGSTLAIDSSVAWRSTENSLALHSIDAHLLAGDGIGAFYRDIVPNEPFVGNSGRVYLHDYYLWFLVRGGLIALLPLAVMFLGALLRLLYQPLRDHRERSARVMLGCGFAALLAVAVVSPFPEQADGAAVFGVLLGIAWTPPLRGTRQAPKPARFRPDGAVDAAY